MNETNFGNVAIRPQWSSHCVSCASLFPPAKRVELRIIGAFSYLEERLVLFFLFLLDRLRRRLQGSVGLVVGVALGAGTTEVGVGTTEGTAEELELPGTTTVERVDVGAGATTDVAEETGTVGAGETAEEAGVVAEGTGSSGSGEEPPSADQTSGPGME
jgi:hypothetical protein